jgi:hypothetical protein
VPRLTATAYADNVAILQLLRSVAPDAVMRPSSAGVIEIEVPLQPAPA